MATKTHLSILAITVFLLGAISCQKKPAPAPVDNCSLPGSTSPLGYTLQSAPKIWKWAVFNPNNNNQIAYNLEYSNYTNFIYKTNLSNPGDTFLITGQNRVYYPKWNKNGWLVLGSITGRLYKIKENGDSLTELNTFTGLNFGASWSPDGEKIIFSGATNQNYAGLFIVNKDGTEEHTLDSLKGFQPVWSPDGSKIAFATDASLSCYDTMTKKKVVLTTIDNSGIDMIGSIAWFPDSKWIIYDTHNGLYKMDIDTRKSVLLRSNCERLTYAGASVSSDGKKILCMKTTAKIIDPDIKYYDSHICTMDADGNNETLVDLK